MTPELFLVENGADGVKVGIDLVQLYYTYRGGVGFQFSAVLVAAALKGTGVPVIADGGILHRRYS
jgi:IMP dehydrogenase